MKTNLILQLNEVSVREFIASDIENKIKWINDPRNNEFLHYDIPLQYDKTLKWFENKDNTTRIDCVIEYQGIPVGLIGLLSLDIKNKKAEFYISMGDDSFKRKGIGFNATKLILEYAFGVLGLHKVYLNVDADNIPACKLYEKVGFVCEGLFKDDLIKNDNYIDRKRYAIISDDVLRGNI